MKNRIKTENREDKVSTIKVLSFFLGRENHCIETEAAKEVIPMPRITQVPYAPDFIRGVTNLRGEIISVMDIRIFFGLEINPLSKDTRVVVTDVAGNKMGVLVDKVEGTMNIRQDSIQPPVLAMSGKLAHYVKGQVKLENRMMILLDFRSIINSEELDCLMSRR